MRLRLLSLLLPLSFGIVLSAPAAEEGAAKAGAGAEETALDRLLATAGASSLWRGARTQADRMGALREFALKAEENAGGLSDRYLITALGGPVDLVHFLGMARQTVKGTERRGLLYKEWMREGGLAYENGSPAITEATPDDLPSNALGALFGEEMREANNDLGKDLGAELRTFFAKLEPVSDSVLKDMTHAQVVLGIPLEAGSEVRESRQRWFTAEPVYLLEIIGSERARVIVDAATALNAAGLEVRRHEGRPIVIERVGTPEPQPPAPPPAAPVVKAPTRAVPVDDKPVRAVPVE